MAICGISKKGSSSNVIITDYKVMRSNDSPIIGNMEESRRVNFYNHIEQHIGHHIECVESGENINIECQDCADKVLLSVKKDKDCRGEQV